MSVTQQKTCEACGRDIPPPELGETYALPPMVCGECVWAAVRWAAKMARQQAGPAAAADEVCPKCGKVHPPAPTLPAGFRRGCGRPDCPVCNPKPAAAAALPPGATVDFPPPFPESITLPMTPDRVMSLEAGTDVVFDDGPITITLRPTPPDAVAGGPP